MKRNDYRTQTQIIDGNKVYAYARWNSERKAWEVDVQLGGGFGWEQEYVSTKKLAVARAKQMLIDYAEDCAEIEKQETLYEINSEFFGEGQADKFEIEAILREWDFRGWDLTVISFGNELRIYAVRNDEFDSVNLTPEWVKIDSNNFYLIVGIAS